MRNIFFIIGVARSATTAVVNIFSISKNSKVFVEQEPKLCIEARRLYNGSLDSPKEFIKKAKEVHINAVINEGFIYGDKNPNYLPFIPSLDALWQPKFIFVVRNGRDVVRSLMNWHNVCRGNIFGMKEDDETSNIISPEQDKWDYSRLRPNCGEPYFKEWKRLSRFEKCSWYWNEFNIIMFDCIARLEKRKWRLININTIKAKDFKDIFDFLGLNNFSAERVKNILDAYINSSIGRMGVAKSFPESNLWTVEQDAKFDKYAGKMMEELRYY
ncbi:MAG: sulfotransferase [Omnitrophica bacterium]|nr:sulfotransferase [Candidatus Omnitrophota bacterium]